MRIVEMIHSLIDDYADYMVTQKNGTILLKPGKIPKCRHMIFKGLSPEIINEYLKKEYRETFPDEFAELLTIYNGFSLYWVKLKAEPKIEFAASMITVYGLPMLPPYDRPKDEDEPFDIRIEDLRRHKKVPAHWLKFGDFIHEYQFDPVTELFCNTKAGTVHAVNRGDYKVLKSWNCIDDCLCDLVNYYSDSALEYDVDF